jgi:hypothetical protein
VWLVVRQMEGALMLEAQEWWMQLLVLWTAATFQRSVTLPSCFVTSWITVRAIVVGIRWHENACSHATQPKPPHRSCRHPVSARRSSCRGVLIRTCSGPLLTRCSCLQMQVRARIRRPCAASGLELSRMTDCHRVAWSGAVEALVATYAEATDAFAESCVTLLGKVC